MKFTEGQDVIVDFDGLEHRAEVLEHRHGMVMVLMEVDVLADYGGGTEKMAPQQTVCVPEAKVRLADG